MSTAAALLVSPCLGLLGVTDWGPKTLLLSLLEVVNALVSCSLLLFGLLCASLFGMACTMVLLFRLWQALRFFTVFSPCFCVIYWCGRIFLTELCLQFELAAHGLADESVFDRCG